MSQDNSSLLANALTDPSSQIFSHHDTLLRKMQRHRSDIFTRISNQIEKSQREVKQCQNRFEEIKRKLGELENDLETEEVRWRDRYEKDLRDSLSRIKQVGRELDMSTTNNH